MIIALLALLGVSVWALLALVALMLLRRRWLGRQPGAFRCAAKRLVGTTPRMGGRRWRRGWGRRAAGFLVWDPMPTLVSSSLLEVRDVDGPRPAVPGEVRRMGESPVVVRMVLADGSEIAVALRDEDAALALGGAAPVGQTRLTPR